jgi:hypothetical protein
MSRWVKGTSRVGATAVTVGSSLLAPAVWRPEERLGDGREIPKCVSGVAVAGRDTCVAEVGITTSEATGWGEHRIWRLMQCAEGRKGDWFPVTTANG